jgi:hypothetical protein
MNRLKTSVYIIALLFLLLFLPVSAYARTYFSISLGSARFNDYHGFYGRPYWRCDRDYYRWLDRDRFLWLDRDRYFFHNRIGCWPRPFYSPGLRIWDDDYCPWWTCAPVIVEGPTVVTERHTFIYTGQADYPAKYDKDTGKLFEKLRQKKAELLEKLRIGDKETRIEAACELAGFSYDDKVKKALEDILLSDPDPELRTQVALSLGKVKNAEFLPILEKLRVADPSEDVRKAADEAIKNIKKP